MGGYWSALVHTHAGRARLAGSSRAAGGLLSHSLYRGIGSPAPVADGRLGRPDQHSPVSACLEFNTRTSRRRQGVPSSKGIVAAHADRPASRGRMARRVQQLNESTEKNAQLQFVSERLQAELSKLAQEKIALQTQVKATLASTSWRLTAPVRAGGNFVRALGSFRRRQ